MNLGLNLSPSKTIHISFKNLEIYDCWLSWNLYKLNNLHLKSKFQVKYWYAWDICTRLKEAKPRFSKKSVRAGKTDVQLPVTYSHKQLLLLLLLQLLSRISCVELCATHRCQPTRLLCLWDFPGKSTGVGRQCLLPLTSREWSN